MARLHTLLLAGLVIACPALAKPFEFVALGDTAYNLPDDYPVYRALIQTINATNPAFTIHVGDTWGATDCTDAEHERVRDFFGNRSAVPWNLPATMCFGVCSQANPL